MNPTTQPTQFVLYAIFAPAIFSGVLLLLTLKWPAGRGWIAALAVGLGYAAGHAANLGLAPPFPPEQSTHALFYIAFAAALAGAMRGADAVPKLVGWLALVAVAAGAPWYLLRNLLQRWSSGEIASTLFFTALAIVALTFVLDGYAARRRGAELPLVLWLATAFASVALALSGSLIYAQFGASLAGVLGACIVFTWIAREVSFARGVTAVFAIVFCCFCLAGVLLSSLPRAAGILLFYAPLAAVAVDRGPVARLSPRAGLAVRVLAVALIAGIAVVLAQLNRPAPSGY
jgi:hypothetical protein